LQTVIESYAGREAGFTLDAQGRKIERKAGYVVGVRNFPSARELSEFIVSHPRYYAGYWRDETEGGREYFDAVQIFDRFSDALAAGREHDQKAIFDYSTMADIRIDGREEVPS
jgi:hypothetical protein